MELNNKVINKNSFYKQGGFFRDSNLNKDYFMLLKQVPALYSDVVTKDKTLKPHLSNCWCIIDKNGVEKQTFNPFDNVYLVENSVIYHLKKKYYNIETGNIYCEAFACIECENFIFLENRFDKNIENLGVWKINKKDGSYEIFK